MLFIKASITAEHREKILSITTSTAFASFILVMNAILQFISFIALQSIQPPEFDVPLSLLTQKEIPLSIPLEKIACQKLDHEAV